MCTLNTSRTVISLLLRPNAIVAEYLDLAITEAIANHPQRQDRRTDEFVVRLRHERQRRLRERHAEESGDRAQHRLGVAELRDMDVALHEREPRIWNTRGKLARCTQRCDGIVTAVDHQGRHA